MKQGNRHNPLPLLMLVIAAAVGTLTLLTKEYKKPDPLITTAATQSFSTAWTLVNRDCTLEECLFSQGNLDDHPLGYAVIKGYYSPVERSAWGETEVCDSFTITNGSEELIRALVHAVDSGNTVHSKNNKNQPVINLGLDLVNQADRQKIIASTLDNQVELMVLSESPTETGAPVCYPGVQVLRAK